MNGNQQLEFHQYMSAGYPYLVADGFGDYFQRVPHAPEPYMYPSAMPNQNQENMYWPMNMNSYRFQPSNPETTSYYSYFEANDHPHNHSPRTEVNQWSWDYSAVTRIDELSSASLPYEERNAVDSTQDSPAPDPPDERDVDHEVANDAEVVLQDNVDPDSMTYEELLDLGETVGTESRGLSRELIKLLPTSRYKASGFFSRKKTRERCVICLLTYKMGDQQITLPCKHVYHKKCGTKWLTINKACPVCNGEVFSSEPRP
ncbi:hypothetical protein Dimus_036749 [Dionaea muscipula]